MTEIFPGYNRKNIVASLEELAKLAMAVNLDFIMMYRNHNDKVKNHPGGSGLKAARRIMFGLFTFVKIQKKKPA